MHIKRITAKHFRRFTDLEIKDIPSTAKLVILAGPNGNGKSSLFDVFLRTRYRHIGYHSWTATYHGKIVDPDKIPAQDDVSVEFHEPAPSNYGNAFYVRTAYRNEPDFTANQIQAVNADQVDHRIARTIDNDATVAKNFQRLYAQGLEDAFETADPNTTLGDFREAVVGNIRTQLETVLPGLRLEGLGNPFKVQAFRFSKGASKNFNYMNLSGGEKATVDLILDYTLKRTQYADSIFCIDEPEAHLNPRIHAKMLQCLFDLTRPSSQLWIATHSIGMLRKAMDLYKSCPDQVAFLDFEQDFDQPQSLSPIVPDRIFWQRSLTVALDDLAHLVSPHTIIACESGTKDGAPGAGFDAEIYNQIFASAYPETRFVSIGSSTNLEGDRYLVVQAVANLIQGVLTYRLLDRDGMTDTEVQQHQARGIRVLGRRNLECYLLDDQLLERLADSIGKPEKKSDVLKAKQAAIAAAMANGHPDDDLKKIAGRLKSDLVKILDLKNAGKSHRAFLIERIVPLIDETTNVYIELRDAIFGNRQIA